MTKRKQILEHIRIETAKHGACTQRSMRLYCENRISHKDFQEAIRKGISQYNRGKQNG